MVGIVKEYLKDFKSLEEYKIAYKMTPIHYQKFRVAIDEIISILPFIMDFIARDSRARGNGSPIVYPRK